MWNQRPAGRRDATDCIHGLMGLAVVDAFSMPYLLAPATNLPTSMLAERLAATFGAHRAASAPADVSLCNG